MALCRRLVSCLWTKSRSICLCRCRVSRIFTRVWSIARTALGRWLLRRFRRIGFMYVLSSPISSYRLRNRLTKNSTQAPSVYNSRVSSVLPTPSIIPRPSNVYFSNGIDSEPTYGPTKKLDFELEMGYFVSKPVPWGERMPIEDAKEHIFGFVLLNDWSARDHQLFEMRPLVCI
jgi:hypothetical protein